MESIERFFKNDKFGEHVGIELLEVSVGSAKVKMEINDYHLNSHKTVHGGAIFTLADLAFAVASNSHGTIAASINANISYIKAATTGTLIAEAAQYCFLVIEARTSSYVSKLFERPLWRTT